MPQREAVRRGGRPGCSAIASCKRLADPLRALADPALPRRGCPTMTRTIEWRNALPTTRIVEHLLAEYLLGARCRSRVPRGPSASSADSRHAEGAEVVLAQQRAAHPRASRPRSSSSLTHHARGRSEHRRQPGRSRSGSGTRAMSHRSVPRSPAARAGPRAPTMCGPASALSERIERSSTSGSSPVASKLTTWPSACTPASVRPAPVVSTSAPQHRAQRLLERALNRARVRAVSAKPENGAPS